MGFNKIFGVGLSRTGSTSLGAAFEILGYSHFGSSKKLLRESKLLGDYSNVFDIARRYDSFEDLPWALIYRELDQEFPDSKFILTVRSSSEAWLRSYKLHTLNRERNFPHDNGESRMTAYGYTSPSGKEREHITFYEKHNKEVVNYFKDRPHQLTQLCWETGDGWQELCSFLGVPEPQEPFPHRNKKRLTGVRWWMDRLRRKCLGR